MRHKSTLLFGLTAYLVFVTVFVYMVAFVGDIVVPRTVDNGGPEARPLAAVSGNLLLMGLFALQHSLMARLSFKDWLYRIVDREVERSIFVLVSSIWLALLFWFWRPIPYVLWDVSGSIGGVALDTLAWIGWLAVGAATFTIDHFALFGLRQVWNHARGLRPSSTPFTKRGLYRIVRHPLHLGFLVAIWSAPRMTAGHLLFSIVMTVYILIAIPWEERDLERLHGEAYRLYRQEVPALLPIRWGSLRRSK